MTPSSAEVETESADVQALATRLVRLFDLAQREAEALQVEARRDADEVLSRARSEADGLLERARQQIAEEHERARQHHERRLEELRRAAQESTADLQQLEQRRLEVLAELNSLWDVLDGLVRVRQALAETLGESQSLPQQPAVEQR